MLASHATAHISFQRLRNEDFCIHTNIFQSKINCIWHSILVTRHIQRQENTSNNEGKSKFIETNSEMIQMIELVVKDINRVSVHYPVCSTG